MPEYLAPGVYVEEVSFRSKSIEGVPTSTTGFAGMTRTGPVRYTYPDGAGGELLGPLSSEPRLVTSFTEYERVYGGLEPLKIPTEADERLCFVAHAARAFFDNGGKRLYVSRVFVPKSNTDPGVATLTIPVADIPAVWRARWPGEFGNVQVQTKIVRSGNVAFADANFGGVIQARRAKAGAVVEIVPAGTQLPPANSVPNAANLRVVQVNPNTGQQTFLDSTGATPPIALNATVLICEMQVIVTVDENRIDVSLELGADPQQKRYIGTILQKDDPEDEDSILWLDWDPTTSTDPVRGFLAARLLIALRGTTTGPVRLTGGNDGQEAQPVDLAGLPADLDDVTKKATGLEALGELDDIAIVAVPDGGTYDNPDICVQAAGAVIAHAEKSRYRIAVVDGPQGSSMNEIRKFRGKFDTKYGALYHPWVQILDPLQRPAQGAPPDRLLLPPSGFVCGIYARSDIERGVFKAPANEVVRGLTKFEININKERQDVLNPEAINALRFFPGRGNRVWGARTMTSDPEWKYVNVRRLFIYVEHSIDKGTQFAVFEPNGPKLWANVTQTIEDFLLVLWRDGALLGDKPEQAFFVRCDRTTMTQNDLDNGRLICLIGIAPVKPAEFVIFRIGQFTADSKI